MSEITTNTSGPPLLTEAEAWRLRALAAEARVEELTDICTKSSHEIEQILGRSLGYPRFCDDQKNFPGTTDADGVAVGEHVAATLAAEAADRINHLNTRVKELEATLAAKENA